ncbi:MAG: hypothetical protein ABIQ01_06590, partial [Pseudolysinimonas sp.]
MTTAMRFLSASIAATLGLGLVAAGATASSAAPGTPDSSSGAASLLDDTPVAGDGYPGDPDAEATLVASEVRRVIDLESMIGTARQLGLSQSKPYRLAVGTTPSLVLVARGAPYTLDELAAIAPRTITRGDDGVYLMTENIVIAAGATLRIAGQEGVVLHLASGPEGFVSIVAAGGSLSVKGGDDLPVAISSWNPVIGT